MSTSRWDRVAVRPIDQAWGRGGAKWLLWLFAGGLLLRFFLANDILDTFYPYETRGAPLIFKIHPGSYLIFACAAFSGLRPVQPDGRALILPSALLVALAVSGVAWTSLTGNVLAIGGLFDLYLVAAAGLFVMSRFSGGERALIFRVVVGALAINLLVMVIEFVIQRRLISQWNALTFRPAGFAGHPLAAGLMYATIAPLAVRLKLPLVLKIGLSSLAVAAVLISGARFASIVAVLALPITTLVALRTEPGRAGAQQWATWLQLVLMATALPLVAAAAMMGGLGYRFAGSLVDQSSLKRLNDFQLLNYISPHDWWFGGDTGSLQRWSEQLFKGDSIESPIVIGIFIYGLPLTIVILGLAAAALLILALRSATIERISVVCFFIIANSSNGLMAKGSILLFVVVVIAAVRERTGQARPRPVSAGTSSALRGTPRWRSPTRPTRGRRAQGSGADASRTF